MEALRIIQDLEQIGFSDNPYTVTQYEGPIIIGGMPKGTESGRPTVMIAIELEDSLDFLVIETTLSLFLSTADALKAKYGDPRASI